MRLLYEAVPFEQRKDGEPVSSGESAPFMT